MSRKPSPKTRIPFSVRWPEIADEKFKEVEAWLKENDKVHHWSQGEILAHYFLLGVETENRERSYPPRRQPLLGVSA